MATLGVDIANHQAGSNIELAAQHVEAFIFKATEGVTFHDSWFPGWAQRAHALGKSWSAYDFARPGSNAGGAAEAKFYCDYVEAAGVGLPTRAVLDLEVTVTSAAATTRHALDWFAYVAARWPSVKRTLYTYPFFAPKFTPDPALAHTADLWIAAYPMGYNGVPNPDTVKRQRPIAPWDHWVAWQFTSIATIPGVATRCDLNILTPEWFSGPPQEDDDMAAYADQLNRIEMQATYTRTRTDQALGLLAVPAVERWYGQYLGRTPDPGDTGVTHWAAAIAKGADPAAVEASIANSAEAKAYAKKTKK